MHSRRPSRIRVSSTALVVAAAGVAPAVVLAPGARADTVEVSAYYQMNEGPGATVMHDSSGYGLDGTIDPAGVQTGVTSDGATGYKWAYRKPNAPPPAPERVIQVPDNGNLEPGDSDFTVEVRYRTSHSFGNIIQKGQSHSVGGQWKIQNPQGRPSCLFKGADRRVSTRAPSALNDDQWHTLTCVLAAGSVTLYVDGVFASKKNGDPGTIDNAKPMTVGGKLECDQVEITCDYFTGQIDYVKISKGDAPPPPPPGEVSYVGSDSAQSGGKSVSVTLPATAAGQQMVMVLSRANGNSALPTPAGWSLLDSVTVGQLHSSAWTRTASAGDVGTNLKITLTANAKMTLTVSAYAGAESPQPYATATDTVNHTVRTTPTVTAPAGAWLVSYWADRSSSTTSWSVSGAPERAEVCNTGGGRVCSVLADSAGPVPAGPAGGLTASTNTASSTAAMWSVVLPAAG